MPPKYDFKLSGKLSREFKLSGGMYFDIMQEQQKISAQNKRRTKRDPAGARIHSSDKPQQARGPEPIPALNLGPGSIASRPDHPLQRAGLEQRRKPPKIEELTTEPESIVRAVTDPVWVSSRRKTPHTPQKPDIGLSKRPKTK